MEQKREAGKRKEEQNEKIIYIVEAYYAKLIWDCKEEYKEELKRMLCNKKNRHKKKDCFVTFADYVSRISELDDKEERDAKNERERFTDMLDEIGGIEHKEKLKDMFRINKQYCFYQRFHMRIEKILDEILTIWYAKNQRRFCVVQFQKLVQMLNWIRSIHWYDETIGVYVKFSEKEDSEEAEYLYRCCWDWYYKSVLNQDSIWNTDRIRENIVEPFALVIEKIKDLEEEDRYYMARFIMRDILNWYDNMSRAVEKIVETRREENQDKAPAEEVCIRAVNEAVGEEKRESMRLDLIG